MSTGIKEGYAYKVEEEVDGGKSYIQLYKEKNEFIHFIPLIETIGNNWTIVKKIDTKKRKVVDIFL